MESGLDWDFSRLLSLPAPERDHVVRMLNHLTILSFDEEGEKFGEEDSGVE